MTASRSICVAIGFAACLAITIPAANASTHPSAKHVSIKTIPKHTVKPPPPSFADTVETLGSVKFQRTYAGQDTSQTGGIIIYVVAGKAGAFLGAVRHEAVRYGGASYKVVYVPHSWTQLNALTIRIAGQTDQWRAQGINLARWGPIAASNKVLVQLRSYSKATEQKLLVRYGSQWVSVSHTPMRQRFILMANRYYDTPPFYGGDDIFPNPSNPGFYCTSGFSMFGNNSGSSFMLTAGHCGIHHPWYTNFTRKYNLGNTSTDYLSGFGGNTHLDAQTIRANSIGIVWGDGTTQYTTVGTKLLGVGAKITFDGSVTGEVHDVAVTRKGPFCENVQGYDICYLGEAQLNNKVVCQPGDSGGPVFERTNSSNIFALGTITAGSPDGSICDYTLIRSIESIANVSLDPINGSKKKALRR